MRPWRDILIAILAIPAFGTLKAEVVTWAIHPRYEQLQRLNGDIYAFQQNGKWGMVRSGDEEVLPAKCDFIFPFTNGYALAGVKDGNRLLLESIVSESGAVVAPAGRYYLPAKNQYVSEGKLVVVDGNGRYGYLAADGRVAVKCQFEQALPFKEGWAPVKQGKYTKYISEGYDSNPSRSVMMVEFHYGEMTMSGCFSDGRAPVAYNRDFALINTAGKKVRKLGETEFLQLYKKNNAEDPSAPGYAESAKYSVYEENGVAGLKEHEAVVVKPQFDSFAAQYSDGTLIAVQGGKYGLLKVSEGEIGISASVAGKASEEIEVDRNGRPASVALDWEMPSGIPAPKVYVDMGDGSFCDVTSRGEDKGNGKSLSVTPLMAKDAESCVIRAKVESDGILLADYEKTFAVSYPVRLRVSSPGPEKIRADENDMGTFHATVFNDSHKQVSVTVTWSTGKTENITIPARGSRTVYATVHVPADFTKDICVTLGTGERACSSISFQTFY